MRLLNDIKGQETAVKYLKNSISSERVATSYLFSGPRGVGKALTARAFLMALVCTSPGGPCGFCANCKRADSLDHPDIFWIKPEKNRLIKIEEVRKIKERLSLKPYEASRSICVVEDAHMMKEESANTLLKVLEEPPGESIIILMTDKKDLLLPTVISRCFEVSFRSLPVDIAKEIISLESDAGMDTANFLAHFTQGSPGKALELIEEGFEEHRRSIIDILARVGKEENSIYMNWEEDTRDGLLEDIEVLIVFFRDVAVCKEGMESLALDKHITQTEAYGYFSELSTGRIYRIVERLVEMKLALLGNVNAKLASQVLPGLLK